MAGIVLRYFDARGRAQFIRYCLRVRDVPYEDERIPLSADFHEWSAIRDDTAIAGPFKKLPVLHYADETVAETLVIAGFLHERLGDSARLSPEDNQRHAMLISSLSSDVMHPLGILLWADRALPGVDVAEMSHRTLERIRRHLEVLNERLAQWQWMERAAERPMMLADCYLWDQLRTVGDVFGAALRLADFELLERYYLECPGRERFVELLESHPCQISGRPGEHEAIEEIRLALDAPS